MAKDLDSDMELLLGCFERGVSQRSRNQRRELGKENKTPKSGISSVRTPQNSEITLAQENVRTPQGKEYQIRSRLGGSKNLKNVLEPDGAVKQISPGVFYGSPLGRPATKPQNLTRLLNDIRRDLSGENRSREDKSVGEFTQGTLTRDAIWATFPRQEQAVQFASTDSNLKLVVFQYQDHVNGQRRFLATTYEEFWNRYKSMVGDYRHHYELIQDGKPCHLYFDLEFNRRVNPGADGEAMVDLLLSVVETAFLDVYDLKYDPSWTVELDSSTEEKFSRHLIIHAQRKAFQSNFHVGAFVGEICKRIHHAKELDEEMKCLFVQVESRAPPHTELFVDQAVYSRNRSFRLPFSSKAGKRSKLMPTKRFRCKTSGEAQVFMDSLICRVEVECEGLLTFGQEDPGRGGTVEFAAWKEKPVESQQRPNFCLSGRSPHPALDIFIESVACVGNVQGKIRSWYWFSEYGVVVYNIANNRFCENIGRPHKSNGVMYIVDFRVAGYYQKCHDHDCRGYRSSLRPIPRHTIPPDYALSLAPPSSCSGQHENGRTRTLFDEEAEDETWWEEVVSSMSSLECASQPQESTKVEEWNHDTQEDDDDDTFWCAVEQQLVELENSSEEVFGLYSSEILPINQIHSIPSVQIKTQSHTNVPNGLHNV